MGTSQRSRGPAAAPLACRFLRRPAAACPPWQSPSQQMVVCMLGAVQQLTVTSTPSPARAQRRGVTPQVTTTARLRASAAMAQSTSDHPTRTCTLFQKLAARQDGHTRPQPPSPASLPLTPTTNCGSPLVLFSTRSPTRHPHQRRQFPRQRRDRHLFRCLRQRPRHPCPPGLNPGMTSPTLAVHLIWVLFCPRQH